MLTAFASVILAATAAAAPPAQADAVLGLWATAPTDNGFAHVEVTRDEAGTFSGTIVWLSQPDYPPDDPGGMGGQPKVDRENPDPSLRKRPILGLPMLQGFTWAGKNEWKGGTIYDPESGKTYKAWMRLQKDGSLKVRGYIGVSLLGRTTVWTRAEQP